ncbi:hypothetical protein GGI21_003172 [Coemansia aciculifera]|nr:hypothetical protein GGI21_003172 [Coemansia aciculifera]
MMSGTSTPTRPSTTLSSAGSPGSLGRHSSPRLRAGSYTDLSRAHNQQPHPPPRFSTMTDSPSSDSTLLQQQQLYASSASIASFGSSASSISNSSSMGSFSGFKPTSTGLFARGSVAAVTAGFDSKADIKLNLGLDNKTLEHGSMGSVSRGARSAKRVAPRRRSKSIGTWGGSKTSSLTK